MWRKCPSRSWCGYTVLGFRRATAGAALLASLESELSDSASLRYLRRARSASAVQEGENLSFPAQENKKRHRLGVFLCLAEKERFELSRRYNRPTPLAGAPLHHLSISPLKRAVKPHPASRGSVACRNIIATFIRFVNSFGEKLPIFAKFFSVRCPLVKRYGLQTKKLPICLRTASYYFSKKFENC